MSGKPQTENRVDNFFYLRGELMRLMSKDPALSKTAWRVATILAFKFMNAAKGGWPSIATLARETGACPRSVQSALTELVSGGYLRPESRAGATTVYRINAERLDAASESAPAETCTPAARCTPAETCTPAARCTPAETCTAPPQRAAPELNLRTQSSSLPSVENSARDREDLFGSPEKQTRMIAAPETRPATRRKTTPEPSVLEILTRCVGEASARDLIDHRQRLRAPLGPRAARELVKQFAATGQPENAVALMISRGWRGFEASWMIRETPRGSPQSRKISMVQASLEILEELEKQRGENGDIGKIIDADFRSEVTSIAYQKG